MTLRLFKIVPWLILVVITFSIGYYLRVYYSFHSYLPYSPYEVFEMRAPGLVVSGAVVKHFTDELEKYPTKAFFGKISNKVFGGFYILYFLGFIAIFLLGRELTGKNFGGFLATLLYSVSSENLLHYTKRILINDSGLSYIMIYFLLFFLLKYLKTKNIFYLLFFIASALVGLTSYHTGALVIILILLGLVISFVYSKNFSRQLFFAFSLLFIFYISWLLIFSLPQIIFENLGSNFITPFIFLILLTLSFYLTYSLAKSHANLVFADYFPFLFLIPATILIFYRQSFFSFLLNLGVNNYFVSAITLNNYFAQLILTHWYALAFLPLLFRRDADFNLIIKRGWFLGILFLTPVFSYFNYYGRVLDYSFPLMFILFAEYWTKKEKLREIIVITTFLLLVISQLIIFNDPYSMRRYYNQNEIESAKKIINLNFLGNMISDLRTAALFKYLGKDDIKFFEANDADYDKIFYDYKKINQATVNNYLLFSESMKSIVYSASFPTKPINDELFKYYNSTFEKVYDDGLLYLYNSHKLAVNNAQFIGQDVPTIMFTGEKRNILISMKNTGTVKWQMTEPRYRLGFVAPKDQDIWGAWRVSLPAEVFSGQTGKFDFEITAPVKPGIYDFQWQMLSEGVEWFGQTTPFLKIEVLPK
ncbi:MAG: hypothetical protein A2729_05100 [Candidatus Buchananbacteria bacterium RIFCSPHIGHO2_01_FULL_39_14]|uniref:Next to BRCA1 central domain-containing protein n=2 Tax=Candidatus Buchananiibacteriota TaxID=1817903 RepID=A0A1G1YRY9_9BACT|nr:MAG: hypothetical protein A2729_05100 [Candidatus Buchananbacteria bacterium RIFCSPHIGHO2_01_FULL_39_14]OGY49121.1 MAG: hypothetical protein A3D39_01720 [Candidatus Buchananbacteria bacterium RIFCSPHIGHO2_02_FULL_39_17]OGY55091.1 MAG: hypothetical protein A2912_00055 [Candidatus Buchananbacteria bacterium RIFCSPLOWO2_01_FULL_40_23b]